MFVLNSMIDLSILTAPSVAPAGIHISTNNDNMLTVTWTVGAFK